MKIKKILGRGFIILLALVLLWSSAVMIDYSRSKKLKPPLFAISTAKDQNGNAYYKSLGYSVNTKAKAFNGRKYVVYDMQFSLFGRGRSRNRTLYDNYHHNPGLLGMKKEEVMDYLKALQYVTPEVSASQETYTEYIDGNDVKVINLIFNNGIAGGFTYEYHNLKAAYEFAQWLRKDLEMTYGEKISADSSATEKEHFDTIKGLSDIKGFCTYFEDWPVVFDAEPQKNIDRLFEGREYSEMTIHFELKVIDENEAYVSVGYAAMP